jgi:hypothetical protein
VSHKTKSASNSPNPSRAAWVLPAAVVGGVIVLAVAFFLLQKAQRPQYVPEVTGRPAASIDQEFFDYGDVHYDTPVETSFQVKNIGDQDLIIVGAPIVEVVEGCCPPDTSVSQKVLAPGEEATVNFTFQMHKGMDGPHEFRVHVQTTDPVEPDKEVVVLSNWIP